MRSPPIVFFDLEGTLIQIPQRIMKTGAYPSMWGVLAELLGPACYEDELRLTDSFRSGEMNYLDFMDNTIDTFKKHGLDFSVYSKLLALVEPEPGIDAVARRLRERGSVICIVTGAMKGVAEPIQKQMKARHLFAGAELYFDMSTNELTHWNLLPSDYEGKVDFMRLLIREYGANAKDCLFVGDGENDVPLAKEVGVSVAYNSASANLRRTATHILDQPHTARNFEDILGVIGFG